MAVQQSHGFNPDHEFILSYLDHQLSIIRAEPHQWPALRVLPHSTQHYDPRTSHRITLRISLLRLYQLHSLLPKQPGGIAIAPLTAPEHQTPSTRSPACDTRRLVNMQAPTPSQRSVQRRSPQADPGPAPNIPPARSFSPTQNGVQQQSRGSISSARGAPSGGGGSRNMRQTVCSPQLGQEGEEGN